MVAYNSPEQMQVQVPAVRQRALHVCRYPVEAPKGWDKAIWLPGPWSGDIRTGTMAEHTLLLPGPGKGTVWPLFGPDVDSTIAGLWVELEDMPLTIPLLAEQQRRFDRDWRTKTVFTPFSVGNSFGEAVHGRVGWAILARLGRFEAMARIAALACVFESRAADTRFAVAFARGMGLPPLYRNNLLAAARAGHPLVDPKGLRWILTEMAAADDAELEQLAAWRPAPGTDDELLVRALTPFLLGDGGPTWEQFRLALWLLGDGFHGADVPFSDPAGILGGVTAVGYVTCEGDGWHPLLDRWADIWSISDAHRAVQASAQLPSAVRQAYAAALGLDPVNWLTGVSFVAMRWWMSFQSDALAKG
ncbi:MAG: hypothetical protein ACRD0J_00690, partial [Acidimicrobiales bacterium]